jgi:hypothetical protein
MFRFGNVAKSTFHLGMSFQKLGLTNNHNGLKAPKTLERHIKFPLILQ